MKPFKTYRQQLKILRDRELIIKNGSKAIRILEKENYYSLINGYKDLFLVKHDNNKLRTSEKYIEGATLEEIYSLFCFDRDLRNILLKELLKFESSIKSKLSYHFSKKHNEVNAYLNMLNYSRDPKQLKQVLKLIATISNVISKQAKKHNPIGHYLDKHEGVPLWVLVKYLTLGNIQNFYECLEKPIQNSIAKDFALNYKRDYNLMIQITSEMLLNILKTATLFRNVCAHGERLYNFKLHKPSKSSAISNVIDIDSNLLKYGNVFTIVSFLMLVTDKKDYNSLIKNLKSLFETYSGKFDSVKFEDILNKMGFPKDWLELLNKNRQN